MTLRQQPLSSRQHKPHAPKTSSKCRLLGTLARLVLGALLISFAPPAQKAAADAVPDEYSNTDTPERELFRMAAGLFGSGNFPAAAKSYRDFVDKYSNHPRASQAQFMLAESLYQQALIESAASDSVAEKKFREPENEFKRALSRIPKGDHLAASATFRLGEIEFNLKHFDGALEQMQRLESEFPGDPLRGEARVLEAESLLAEKKAPQAYAILRAALRDQPVYEQIPSAALTFGIALFEVGDSSDALHYLERFDSPTANFFAARAYLALKKPLVAIERFKKTIQADPQGPLVELSRYLIGESFFISKDYPSAIQTFEEYLRNYSMSALRPGAMYKIGLCQYERQDYLAARGSFQSVLQLAPNSEFAPLSLYMTAESFLKENRLKEANFAYADMAASYSTPLAGNAQFKQGWTHFKQGEYPAAEATLKTMLLKYPGHSLSASAALLVGNTLTREQKYGEAVKSYQRALDILEGGDLPEERQIDLREACLALLNRANLLGRDYGSLVSGYQYIAKHVKPTLNPWRAITLIFTAEGYYRQGLYDQAPAIYREAAGAFPVSPESAYAQDGIAWSLFAAAKYAAAEREREKLSTFQNRPDVAPTKTVLEGGRVGEELFIQNSYEMAAALFNQKKYLEALDGYEGFARSHPSHPLAGEAELQAGWCYYRLEHFGQALKAWQEAETKYANTPVAAKAAWSIADTYFRAGHYEEAIATYERILQNYPQDAAVNHAKLRIAQSYYNAKDVVKAISAFEGILRESPNSAEAAQVLDFLTNLLYQPEAKTYALDSLRRVADFDSTSPTSALARFRVARFLFESADYPNAVENLEKLMANLNGRDEMMDAQYYLAESYYQLKRFQDAALAYERFTNNFPGDKRYAAALFHLGASRFKTEDFAGAASAFSKLSSDYPMTSYAPVALFNSALAYRKLGKWEEASLALKNYMKNYPEEAKGSNATTELAAIYEEHRQFPLLIDLLSQTRESLSSDDSKRVEMTERLGEAYAASGDDEKAVGEYRAAAKSPYKNNPFRLAALAKLGEYFERTEQWLPAQQVYDDLAANATEREWVEAAKARGMAAREKLAGSSPEVSSTTKNDDGSGAPRQKKKKERSKQ